MSALQLVCNIVRVKPPPAIFAVSKISLSSQAPGLDAWSGKSSQCREDDLDPKPWYCTGPVRLAQTEKTLCMPDCGRSMLQAQRLHSFAYPRHMENAPRGDNARQAKTASASTRPTSNHLLMCATAAHATLQVLHDFSIPTGSPSALRHLPMQPLTSHQPCTPPSARAPKPSPYGPSACSCPRLASL